MTDLFSLLRYIIGLLLTKGNRYDSFLESNNYSGSQGC